MVSIEATPVGPSPNVAMAMRCASGMAPHNDSSSANLTVIRRCTSSFSMNGNFGTCFTTIRWPKRAEAISLTSPISMSSKRRFPSAAATPFMNAARRDLGFAFGTERLGDEEDVAQGFSLGGLSVSRLIQEFSDHRPVPFARHPRAPTIELGLVPEIVQQRPERELRSIGLDASGISSLPRVGRGLGAGLRKAEVELQDRDAVVGVLLDRATRDMAEAREFVGGLIRVATRVMLGAGFGHALEDMAIAEARDIHRHATRAAEAKGTITGRMSPRQRRLEIPRIERNLCRPDANASHVNSHFGEANAWARGWIVSGLGAVVNA